MIPVWYPSHPVSVFGIKVNGMTQSSNFSVGPTAMCGLNSITKSNQASEMNGDFDWAPILHSWIIDNDLNDIPTAARWPY